MAPPITIGVFDRVAYQRSWYEKNRPRLLAKAKLYQEGLDVEKLKAYKHAHYIANKEKNRPAKRAREKFLCATDIKFKLIKRLRTRLYQALKGNFKAGSAVKLLGCSIAELKIHLESQFKSGMTWENYGTWHIDHIRPLASFDLQDIEQLAVACHYTNLQPLWALENLIKGDR